MYSFLINMWIMRKIDQEYLQARVNKGQITEQEFDQIILTAQVE